ncbi:hypothetical protein FRB90_008469 [Tulasnella sp. 427]|nr:hypothetical protein FRB90_008469 [Tulasnella sp. 427]
MSLLALPIPPSDLDIYNATNPATATSSTTFCPRCRLAVPRNVSLAIHEATCPSSRTSTTLAVSLTQDGRPMRIRSNDNSSRSSSNNHAAGGSHPVARNSASPSSRDDGRMSDGESTSVSRNSPGHSIAYSDASDSSTGRRYHLEVIQHPERTAEIGNGAVLSRLPLSPPLVVKITVEDAEGNTIPAHTEMPFLAAHLSLYNEDGSEPVDIVEGPSSPNGRSGDPERMLYGTLVSSLHHLKDANNQPGMFFIFPDVSVRRRGTYTLLVNLLRLTDLAGGMNVMGEGRQSTALASAQTNPFNVVLQSEYTAPAATQLTTAFHRQGARM